VVSTDDEEVVVGVVSPPSDEQDASEIAKNPIIDPINVRCAAAMFPLVFKATLVVDEPREWLCQTAVLSVNMTLNGSTSHT
jgi:hypothetical protein